MVINICDVPKDKALNIITIFDVRGYITRENENGLCDVCLKDGIKLEVHNNYVVLQNPANLNNDYALIIDNSDYSTIYIH